jgi:hypothetical protein
MGGLDDVPHFRIVTDYVAPAMTEERVMWFGRGMRGKGPLVMDEPTQRFRIGAYIFPDPIAWDEYGNYIYHGEILSPTAVFARVQQAWADAAALAAQRKAARRERDAERRRRKAAESAAAPVEAAADKAAD